jgi:hypothetical protein
MKKRDAKKERKRMIADFIDETVNEKPEKKLNKWLRLSLILIHKINPKIWNKLYLLKKFHLLYSHQPK